MVRADLSRPANNFLVTIGSDHPLLDQWAYTLTNNEPVGSPDFIYSFQVLLDAPTQVTGSAPGWAFQTDNQSFVTWTNTDAVLPYPHDVAPGASLGGFLLSSPGSGSDPSSGQAFAWDHVLDMQGPSSIEERVVAPGPEFSVVPEPSMLVPLVLALSLLMVRAYRQRRLPARTQ